MQNSCSSMFVTPPCCFAFRLCVLLKYLYYKCEANGITVIYTSLLC
uniref:Uncharacterized protein n=1 Tax=Arundo donax TaxID=35708 RepID=A0A0A9F3K2_ARUDO